MKEKIKSLYEKFVWDIAKLSHARRLKVGALIVSNDGSRIMSFGYNGTPPGQDNNCEDEHYDDGCLVSLTTKQNVIHAEMNAILKLAQSHDSCKDSILFLTHAPCIDCAKHVIMSGIKEVYYQQDYRSLSGVEELVKAGISVNKKES